MNMHLDKKWLLLAVLMLVAGLLVGCSGDSGLPKQPGEYGIQPKSITYDGQDYSFYWIDKDSSVHRATVEHLKMVQDERAYLLMQDKEPTLHLRPDDPINVKGEDRQGSYSSPWFPFFAGTMLGRMTAPSAGPYQQPYAGSPTVDPNTPTYRYPPTSSFGRDDTLNGSITNNKPSAPDYGKVSPNPNAVSGKGEGTGGGTAASSKSGGTSTSGQSGGSGSGSAASGKGGFQSGSQSFSNSGGGSSSGSKVGGGSGKSSSGSSGGGSKSSGGSRSSGGGRSGGK